MSSINIFPVGAVLSILIPVFFYLLSVRSSKSLARFWSSLPSVGVDEGVWFPWTRAILNSVTNSLPNALQGYNKYSKNGIPFLAPSTGCGAVVVMPPSYFKSLWNKTESELIASIPQSESLGSRYTMDDPDVWKNLIQFDVVRNQLTKRVDFFVDMTQDELGAAFHDQLGDCSDWQTVSLWDLCTKVVSRAGNRAFVGLPLCRDEALLEDTRLYATATYGAAAMINALPTAWRPALGPVVAFPAKWYLRRVKKTLVPFVEDRLKYLENDSKDEPVCKLSSVLSDLTMARTMYFNGSFGDAKEPVQAK
jgi:hypothetical protein